MAMPNFNPDNHGEEITGLTDEQRRAEVEALTAVADMSPTVEALAAKLGAPIVPDGGPIGRVVAPHVTRAAQARGWLRIWYPALIGTGAFAGAAIVLPMTGPLAVYGLGLVGFGWWHCAGRPGPVAAVQMLVYTAADALARIREWVTRLAERRGRYEARRTNPDPKQA